MEKYVDFAYIYDKLTFDVDYIKTADYIEKIFEKFCHKKPHLVLDLACGTGTMCVELEKRGYDMIGIDFSENMLDVAMKKSEGKNILYLNQDITEFELYGTVDAVLCLLDSVNHITDLEGVKNMFSLMKNYLNPDGIFIFDVNTKYKFENILKNNIFTYDDEDIYYVWENEYDENEKMCDFYLTFFVKEGDNYRRIDEYHCEKCYDDEMIECLARETNLEILAKYDEHTFSSPKEDSERVFYVLKRK